MATIKIGEAQFVKDNISIIVTPDSMDKEQYEQTFRGYLFCPYPACEALLEFVCRTDPPINYFRTWKKKKHNELCPYNVEYQELVGHRREHNPDYQFALSDEHIDAVLRRAHRILNGQTGSSIGNRTSNISRKSIVDDSLEPSGVAALLGDCLDLSKGHEPKVFIRNATDLSSSDENEVRCVIGRAHFMWIETDYAYLNLEGKQEKIKVHFNEAFKSTNESEFKLFDYVKRYIIDNPRKLVCCIGRVIKTDTGYNIRPDRAGGFSIDAKKLYEIVNHYVQSGLGLI